MLWLTGTIATPKPSDEACGKYKARYIAGTKSITGGPEGIVDISGEAKLLFIPEHGGTAVEIPYSRITSIEIRSRDSQQKTKQYVAVAFKAPNGTRQGVVLEFGPHITRSVLATLSAKSGKKVAGL